MSGDCLLLTAFCILPWAGPSLLAAGAAALAIAGVLVASHRAPARARWALILLGAQALWISLLARPALGIDGGLSLTLAIMPLAEMAKLNASDVHPPAYYAFLHGWIDLAGLSPFAARYPTVLFMLGAVAGVGAAGRRLGGPRAGETAGLIAALTPGVALLATTVRDFSPGLFLAGVAVYLWLGFWPVERHRRRSIILCGLALGAGLWTTYLFGLLVLALGAASLLGGWRTIRAWAASAAVGGALALPWFAYELPVLLGRAASGQVHRTPGIAPEDVGHFLSEVSIALAGSGAGPFPATIDQVFLTALTVWVLLAAWGALRASPPDRRPLAIAAVAGPLLLGGCYALMRTWTDIRAVERYAIFAVPFFAPAAGYALSRPRARPVLAWILAGLVAVPAVAWSAGLMVTRAEPRHDWQPVATVAALDRLTHPGDAVVFITLEQPSYYQALSRHPVGWRVVPVLPPYLAGNVRANAERTLRPLLGTQPRLWAVAYLHGLAGTEIVLDWLRDRTFPVAEVRTPDSTIWGFVNPLDPLPEHRFDAAFEDGLVLQSAAFPVSPQETGDLPVAIAWLAHARPRADYTVFVHLVTPDQSRQIAGHDGLPLAGRALTSRMPAGEVILDRHGLVVPPGTPPGHYLLTAGLYRDGRLLPRLNGETQVVLGVVRVTGDAGTRGRGDAGTRRRGDAGTRRRGDPET